MKENLLNNPDALTGAATGIGIVGIVIYLAFCLFFIIVSWKIFTKAGQPGWAVLIPVYNFVVFLKICGRPVWWILLFILVIPMPIVAIILTIDLAKRFGKDIGFAIGLLVLGIIFYPILAFGNAQYQPK